MIGRILTATAIAVLLCAWGRAHASDRTAGPEYPSIFESQPDVLLREAGNVDASLRLEGRRVDYPTVTRGTLLGSRAAYARNGTGRTRRTVISVICSAILPGLGELYLYRESGDTGILARVPIFLAAEGYLWYGYARNHSKGKDLKQDYMNYADEHWSTERFLEQHPCCEDLLGCPDYEYYNEYCQGEYHYFLFTPREMDEEEYYENLGKYDAFVYGWDDWNVEWNDLPPAEREAYLWTPHRTYYWSLRDESDKYLLRADQHLMLMIVNRVISMIDAGLLAHRMGRDGSAEEEGWSIELEPGWDAPSLSICYRF